MVTLLRIFLFLFCLCSIVKSNAQLDTTKPLKVAVFIPMFVDEVFKGEEIITGKNNLPKKVISGLEFYNGVMLAIDSLQKEGAKVEISIYDTKKAGLALTELFISPEFENVGLIIASISNTQELKNLSELAMAKQIPLISATYPNYVGISANPYFVLLNSSFQAHLEGLYKYMQKHYVLNNIFMLTKNGKTEDFIKNYLNELNKNTPSISLKMKWVNINDSTFNTAEIMPQLDTAKENVVLIASPNETFGLGIVRNLSKEYQYNITAIGMPTWDNIKDLDGKDCRNVNIVYSTPFLYAYSSLGLLTYVNDIYKEKYYSKPSDMALKGYETTYHFSKLLLKHKEKLINNIADKDFTLFNKFSLEPVKLKKSSTKPDLIENKRLYFIMKQQGNVKSIS